MPFVPIDHIGNVGHPFQFLTKRHTRIICSQFHQTLSYLLMIIRVCFYLSLVLYSDENKASAPMQFVAPSLEVSHLFDHFSRRSERFRNSLLDPL